MSKKLFFVDSTRLQVTSDMTDLSWYCSLQPDTHVRKGAQFAHAIRQTTLAETYPSVFRCPSLGRQPRRVRSCCRRSRGHTPGCIARNNAWAWYPSRRHCTTSGNHLHNTMNTTCLRNIHCSRALNTRKCSLEQTTSLSRSQEATALAGGKASEETRGWDMPANSPPRAPPLLTTDKPAAQESLRIVQLSPKKTCALVTTPGSNFETEIHTSI
jgi:hypothetical protein